MDTCLRKKPHQAVVCAGWRRLNDEEPPPDCEAPPRDEWTERNAQTQRERSGRSLKEDDRTWRLKKKKSKKEGKF